jgi:O-antigen/teichoic acid export membrane protein
VIARPIIEFFYGDEFLDGVTALRVLAVASVVSVAWRYAEAELFGRARARGAAVATAVAAVIVVGGTAALAGLEATGAALASLVGYSAGLVVVVGALRKVRRA